MAEIAPPPGFAPVQAGGRFLAAIGPILGRQTGEGLQFGFRVEPHHANAGGICHGGMIATFCDTLLPLALQGANAELRRHRLVTVSLQLDYLAPSRVGAWVQADVALLKTTRSLVFVQGLVNADGSAVARFSGVLKIGPPISTPTPFLDGDRKS
ncbi:MAG: PaaI family thioesterase [Rubrivivax sp.]